MRSFSHSFNGSIIHSNSCTGIHGMKLGGTLGEGEDWNRPGVVQPPDRQGSGEGSRHAQPNQTVYLPGPHPAPPGTLGTNGPPAGLR